MPWSCMIRCSGLAWSDVVVLYGQLQWSCMVRCSGLVWSVAVVLYGQMQWSCMVRCSGLAAKKAQKKNRIQW